MRYYLIAGEASGDLHGSNLMKALKDKDPEAEFRVWGGDRMEAQGAELVKHYRDLAFMGFLEVAMNIRTILGNLSFCKKDIESWNPDMVILIDYPGFNLRIAPFVKSLGIRCVYYISPQVWAWKENRVKAIKKYVDQMLVILPFEKDFYQKHGLEVEFVGHPLLDALEELSGQDLPFKPDEKVIALLPGSRKQEIAKMLPIYLKAVKGFEDYQIAVAGAPGIDAGFYEQFRKAGSFTLVSNQTYTLLKRAEAALVTSGTATLETALMGTPEVVAYKGSWISYQIGRQLVKVDFISLVNLIMGRKVVEELIQNEMNPQNLKAELNLLLKGSKRDQMLKDFADLKIKLGGSGASQNAAKAIIDGARASGFH
jgi:lipid-A-disaccharide synthase